MSRIKGHTSIEGEHLGRVHEHLGRVKLSYIFHAITNFYPTGCYVGRGLTGGP